MPCEWRFSRRRRTPGRGEHCGKSSAWSFLDFAMYSSLDMGSLAHFQKRSIALYIVSWEHYRHSKGPGNTHSSSGPAL